MERLKRPLIVAGIAECSKVLVSMDLAIHGDIIIAGTRGPVLSN